MKEKKRGKRERGGFLRIGANEKTDSFLVILFGLFSISSLLLEYAAFHFKGPFSLAASRIWFFMGVLTFLYIAVRFVHAALWRNLREGKWLDLLLLVILFFVFCRVLGNVKLYDLSYEAALEVRDALQGLILANGNYTGAGFWGYPARQYIFNALPSLLLGRSLFALQLGFGLYFILGICCLYTGLRQRCVSAGVNTVAAVLPLYVLFVFPYVTEYYLSFDQVLNPAAYGMCLIGLFLLLTDTKPCFPDALGFLWLGCMSSFVYPQALSLTVIAAAFVFIYLLMGLRQGVKNRAVAFPVENPLALSELFVLILVDVIGYLVISYQTTPATQSLMAVRGSFPEVVLGVLRESFSDIHGVFWGGTALFVVFWIIWCMTGCFTCRDLVLVLWMLGVFISGQLILGYANASPETLKSRFILVIPFLLTAVSLHVVKGLSETEKRLRIRTVISFCLACGFFIWINFSTAGKVNPVVQPRSSFLIQDIEAVLEEEGLTDEDAFEIILLSDDLVSNLYDYTGYFYPNARVIYADQDDEPGYDPSLFTVLYDSKAIAEKYEGREVRGTAGFVYKDQRRGEEYAIYHGILTEGEAFSVVLDEQQ